MYKNLLYLINFVLLKIVDTSMASTALEVNFNFFLYAAKSIGVGSFTNLEVLAYE